MQEASTTANRPIISNVVLCSLFLLGSKKAAPIHCHSVRYYATIVTQRAYFLRCAQCAKIPSSSELTSAKQTIVLRRGKVPSNLNGLSPKGSVAILCAVLLAALI
ncbi:hypothetical protein Dimus_036930 [Dionaea muscipula]